LGFGASSELGASPPPARPFSDAAPSRRSRAVPEPCGVRLSWGSCSHGHFYAGCPFFFRHAPPRGGSCGARVAKPSPVPSSGFLPLSTVLASSRLARSLLGSAVRRGPRRFAALFHAARVPGASLQSFPFPGSRTHSRGPSCSLAGSRSTAAGAVSAGASRSLSPVEPALCRSNPPGGGSVTHEPGRRFPAIVSPVASTRSVSEPHVPSPSYRHWAHRLAAGTPASKLCSPRESVLRRPLRLARLRPPVGALLGFFALQSSLHNGSGFGISRRRTQGAEAPCYVHLRAPSRRGCIPRPGLRRLGSRTQDPSIRRVDRTPRITVERRSSSPGASRAPCTPTTCSRPRPRGRKAGASCSCPLSAAPRAFLPFTPGSPERAPDAGPRRRSCVEPSALPRPSRGGEASTPLAGRAPVPRFRVDRDAGWLAPVRTTLWTRPSRGSSLWWAHLLPGGPALMGFRPSSTRLDGASDRQRSARTPFGPEALRALRRG
jgi:hypothetical protein